MLKTYNQLFEKSIGKFPHLTISMNFIDFINYNLSTSLKNFRTILYAVETDISFIDIGEDLINVTYLPYNKDGIDDNPFKSKHRQKMKIGRFVKKMYDDNDIPITNSNLQIDDIVDTYKQYMESIILPKKLEVVYGEKIRFWYLEDNYVYGNGTLNRSCMRQEKNQQRLDIYVDNPDRISMLILTDDNNKLLGRSLLWKLDSGEIYMDRVYVEHNYQRLIFAKYAEDNNIKITYNKILHNDIQELNMFVTLKNINYENSKYYPYMDTFSYCYLDDYLLSNNYIRYKKVIVLDFN